MRSEDWELLETIYQGAKPSQAWEATSDDDLASLYQQLRLLRVSGCPADIKKAHPNLQFVAKYKPQGWRGRSRFSIYVLKTTPARWRLYLFVPNRTARQIEIIHAVEKKKQKRNPADLPRCQFILDRIVEGTTECARIHLPDTR